MTSVTDDRKNESTTTSRLHRGSLPPLSSSFCQRGSKIIAIAMTSQNVWWYLNVINYKSDINCAPKRWSKPDGVVQPSFHDRRHFAPPEDQPTHAIDNMVKMLEIHTVRLENIVHERSQELYEQKQKADSLLYSILPKVVAEQLKSGTKVLPEYFEAVTIFVSDIVKFTPLAAASTPIQVVTFLGLLYNMFDEIIDRNDVYKVETSGDAYIVASGLPTRNGNALASEIATFPLQLLNSIVKCKIPHMAGKLLQLVLCWCEDPILLLLLLFFTREKMTSRKSMAWGPPTGRNYPCLVHTQLIMTESFEKETDARIRWYFKTVKAKRAADAAAGVDGRHSKQYDVFKKRLMEGFPKPAEGVFAKVRDRKPADYRMRIIAGDDFWVKLMDMTRRDPHLVNPMYPVDRPTRDLLYEGVSQQDEGRVRYQKERYKKPPEVKYKFPLTNNWDYGWRLSDAIKKDELKNPKHVRKNIVEQTFFSRNGVPELDQSAACKCF